MGRIYSVVMPLQTITAANADVDLLEVLPADDKPVKLRGYEIGQISEIGDAQEEGVRIRVLVMTATVTSGSSGATATPRPTDSADAACGAAVEVGNTAVATTSGTTVAHKDTGWNIRGSPVEFWYPDERFCPKAKQGEGLFVRWETTAADNVDVSATFWIEEE